MAPKFRRGPILCDAGKGDHPALNPQVVTVGDIRPRVMCANCALAAASEATRAGQPFLSEPLAVVQAREHARRCRASAPVAVGEDLAEVVDLKRGQR